MKLKIGAAVAAVLATVGLVFGGLVPLTAASSQPTQAGMVKALATGKAVIPSACDTLPKVPRGQWATWVDTDHNAGALPSGTVLNQSENLFVADNATGVPLRVGLNFGQARPSLLKTINVCTATFTITADGHTSAIGKWQAYQPVGGKFSITINVNIADHADGSVTLNNILAFVATGTGPPPTGPTS